MEHKETTKSELLIAHMGDVHLRDSQYANPSRSHDFIAAFEQAVQVSGNNADVMVCCGDIFDTSRPSPRVIGQLIKIDHLLQSIGKTMLCITGNHDRSNPSWLDTLFPRSEGPGIVPLDDRSIIIDGFKFVGIPPYTATQYRANAQKIADMCSDADVVLYHGFVTGVVPMMINGDANPLSVDEMPSSPTVKAVLLADIHVQGSVQHHTETCQKLVAYPGSLEMCSASENTEKSVPIVKLTKTSAEVIRAERIFTRLFISARVQDQEQLDALVARLRSVADQHPVVIVEFDRSLTDVVTRVHAALDAEKALIRCKPLPHNNKEYVRHAVHESEDRTIRDFMLARFEHDVELGGVAMALIDRGEQDAANILSEFIESNTQQQ